MQRMRPVLTSIICLMVLLGSFASVTRAYAVEAASGEARWVEVCTAMGVKLVDAQQGEGKHAPDDGAAQHAGHCPWCAASSDMLGMPPAPLAWGQPLVTGRLLPVLFLHAPAPLFAWASAQPRAPPARA